MNKAINLAGLPNTFTRLLLNLLNSAVIHVPGQAPERHFLEQGGQGGLYFCALLWSFQNQFPLSCNLAFSLIFIEARSNRVSFELQYLTLFHIQVTDFETEILDTYIRFSF